MKKTRIWRPLRQKSCAFCASDFWPSSGPQLFCGEACHFWFYVDIGEPDECWPWLGGSIHKNGYGQFSHRSGLCEKAHRAAYRLTYGEPAVIACHHCDKPICCNPGHIYNGTKQSNARDMMERGVTVLAPGERHSTAILTTAQVLDIRARFASGARICDIARAFGMRHPAISAVVYRRSWRHLAETA